MAYPPRSTSLRAREVERRLRLPEQALAIAEAQPVIFGNPQVFAGRGKGPFNSWSQCKEELDAKILEQRRKHDKNAN